MTLPRDGFTPDQLVPPVAGSGLLAHAANGHEGFPTECGKDAACHVRHTAPPHKRWECDKVASMWPAQIVRSP